MATSTPSLPVVFTTKTQYPLPSQKFMVPATWKRYQLSQLVNKALDLTKVVPFDFLVCGDLLRASLGEWAAEKGVGEEETLEIEYIESVLPPQRISELPHEEWVSAISCAVQGIFLTASYDGSVRAFDYSQELRHTALVHSAPITALCTVPNASASEDHLIATSSHDLTARLTSMTLPSDPSTSSTSHTLASLHLHTAPLSSIAANKAGTHLLTASWDALIGVWDTKVPDADEVPREPRATKRRRVGGEDDGVKRKAPAAVLKSHTARVSAVAFDNAGDAVSCGFDSTVRLWDVDSGVCSHTISASEKPFLALALASPTTALAASTDRTTTLYDIRAPATVASALSFAHPATPVALAMSRGPGAQQFVSGAYDGGVRLWDLRSPSREIARMQVKDAKKVLGVDWAAGVVGIAGEGGVELWRVGEEAK
ncbi:ribosome biogenesis protein YTM1 [Auriscalpium vulgare]|uniref:Ribosome biogenesis protein YTM1 n=1 Tax=Auriscalpium vulgare TaxID=40419 RepID=A0ACB8RR12_9AGAM|nr:ribosome biogenesis protein YTM1 [Auriscalpium vulgare]